MDGKHIILLMISINIMLYVFGFNLVNDPLSTLLKKDQLDSGNIELSSDLQSTIPSQTQQSTNTNILSFIVDGLGMVFDMLKVFFNILTAPVALFVGTALHPVMAVMLGVPFTILYLLTIMAFIRGAQL
jgi:hypothetical protein